MEKKILTIVIIALLTIPSFAQRRAIEEAGFWNNWFIQAQVDGSYTYSENHDQASFGEALTPHVALSLGKNFSPIAGARALIGVWNSKSFFETMEQYKKSYTVDYIQFNFDGMLNFTNIFMGYKPDRVFNLIGILDIGYAHEFSKSIDNSGGLAWGFVNSDRHISSTNNIVPRIGLQADFRMSDVIYLNLEVDGNLYPDDFNGRVID